jgi:glycogen synthase
MQLDYSWDFSAKKYVALYMKALEKVGIQPL